MWILLALACSDDDCTETTTRYIDADGDGVGDAALAACEATDQPVAEIDGDCDDTDDTVFPGAPEICGDGVDSDCAAGEAACQMGGSFEAISGFALTGLEDARDFGAQLWIDDINGDGAVDLLVSDELYKGSSGTTEGAVWLVEGPIAEDRVVAAGISWIGPNQESHAGSALHRGDVDGDGAAEILVGARFDNPDLFDRRGAIYGLNAAMEPLWAVYGEEGSEAGSDLTVADLDGDGVDDLITGAPGWNTKGAAYVYAGPVTADTVAGWTTATLLRGKDDSATGTAVLAGDLNGDGQDDLLIGAPNIGQYRGVAYALMGPVSAMATVHLPKSEALEFSGEETSNLAGNVLAVGDLNGDGAEDLVTTAWRWGNLHKGRAYVVLGPLTTDVSLSEADAVLTGVDAEDQIGTSVSAEDLNGDGVDDLIVGSMARGGAGGALVVYGPVSGALEADAEILGPADAAAWNAAAGDLTGDGTLDLLVGSDALSTVWVLPGLSE